MSRFRIPVRWILAVALAATALVVAGPTPLRAQSYPLAHESFDTTARPLGAVTVIGDSVLLGSGIVTPTLPDQLAAAGWGPIRFRASVGMFAGPPDRATSGGRVIQTWRSHGWDAPTVIVNLGANDVGLCFTNLACARSRILAVVDTIGPGHRIWWPMITWKRSDANSPAVWNLALQQIAAERPDFFTWNWPHEMATGGYSSSDNIHLSGTGYRKRSERMAQEFTAAVAMARRVGGDVTVPATAAAPSRFVPLTPQRIIDSRTGWPGRRPSGSSFPLDLARYVPANATSVALNVTAAGASEPGYLSVGPCGQPRGASTVNFTAGTPRGAMAIGMLDADKRVCVFNHGTTDVVVDLQGAFVTGTGGAGLTPLAADARLVDTGRTARQRRIVIPVSPQAQAVAVNLTVDDAAEAGWLRVAPCGATTGVSNVNFTAREAVAGAAFVAVSAQGTICVDVTTDARVIVDQTGTFGSGGLSFVPVRPTRMLDTRSAIGGWAPIQGAGQTLEMAVAPRGAEAVTGTMTIVQPTVGGYLVGHRCGNRPPTSSVNAARGGILANLLTTGISGGRLCVYSHVTTHSLFDVTGWWVR